MVQDSKQCPTCKQSISEEHENLIKKFSTKKYLDRVKDKLSDKSDKKSANIIKEIVILFAGFVIGKFLVNMSLEDSLIWVIIFGFLMYLLLGEILGAPLFKWYITKTTFDNKETLLQKWDEIKNRFPKNLDSKLIELKKGRFVIFGGKIEEENAIIFASEFKKGIDFFNLQIFKPTEQKFNIKEDANSLIQSFIPFKYFPNRGWFPKISSAFSEGYEYNKFKISIIAPDKALSDTYEIVCKQIESILLFNKDEHYQYDSSKKRETKYDYKKGFVDSSIIVQILANDLSINVYYHEAGGIEYDRQELYAKEHKKFLKVITNKFNEVIKDLGSKNIKVKLHSTSTSMYKGKYQQDEIIKVEKFSDRKNFIY